MVDVVYERSTKGCWTLTIGKNANCSDIEISQYSSLESESTYESRQLISYWQ